VRRQEALLVPAAAREICAKATRTQSRLADLTARRGIAAVPQFISVRVEQPLSAGVMRAA